jgi:uncharacterized protein (TIGR02611 family)
MSGRRENTDELDQADPVVPGQVVPGHLAAEQLAPGQLTADQLAAPPEREDRWHWRRKIRARPRQLRVYRVAVAIAGLLLIVLGLVTGPIPGPGGIPLILLGLATWASEFAWAHRLMHSFKAMLHRFRSWNRWQQTGCWVAFFALCGLCGYSFMVVMGVPTWVPPSADLLLEQLPGL